MQLSQLINISIARETASVSQVGFGVPMIIGPNKTAAGVGSYSSLTAVLAEPGITSGTDEYKAAQHAFAQTPKPATVKIGKTLAKVAQVDTITPTPVNTTVYEITIVQGAYSANYSYTSDGSATAAEIVAGLLALVNADTTNTNVVATGSTTLILTSNLAGQPFSTSTNGNPDMALVHTTANVGVVESIAALSLNYDDNWYGLISTFRSIQDVMQIAGYIEGVIKLFGVSSSSASLYDPTSTTDIAYLTSNGNFFRTFVMYSSDAANYPEASYMGAVLPTIPGSETWAFKNLATTATDNLSQTQINALKAKNCNYFVPVGGQNLSFDGKVAGDEYIDIIRLIDAIQSGMMTAIFGSFVNNLKVPFTNGGITLIEGDVRGVLKTNQKTGGVAPDDVDDNGNLVPGFEVDFPNIFDTSANDRAQRILNGGTWSARLSGAIQATNINGTVTV